MTETSLREFVPLEKLGEGSFSTVYKVKRVSDGKIYALKKVRMNNLKEKEKLSAVNEIRILASLETPFVVGYKEAIYDEKLNLLCIVMEYASRHAFIQMGETFSAALKRPSFKNPLFQRRRSGKQSFTS